MKSEYVLNHFLKRDHERAQIELDCYAYCHNLAIENFINGKFEKSAAYHENASRSLVAIENMRKDKQAADQAAFFLGQIKAQQDQHELLRQLGL